MPQAGGQDYGPNLFPILIGIGLLVCGMLLVRQGIAERGTVPLATVGDRVQNPNNPLNVALLIGSIVLYILLFGLVGFIPLSLLSMTVLLVRLGTGLGASLLIAMATTFIIHTLFAKVLLVPGIFAYLRKRTVFPSPLRSLEFCSAKWSKTTSWLP